MSKHRAVPMVDLAAQHAPLRAEINEAIARVLDSQRFVGGPEVEALERSMARLCETEFAVGCASGTDALILALEAAGVGTGDAVLCPSFTFFATAGAIARLGARPVFVDIDPATLDVGPDQAEAGRALCPDAKALLAVHLFGRVAPMGPLLRWADQHGIALIEDAAQAIGGRDADGIAAGAGGLAGCFSFFPSKNLGALGDGGVITTRSEAMAERLRTLRNHGAGPDGFHRVAGTNSRIDALQAAVLGVKLRYLDEWTKRRSEHAAEYDRLFTEAGATTGQPVDRTRPLSTPRPEPAPGIHVHNQYVVRVEAGTRKTLRAQLAEDGIETRIYYERGVHLEPCFAGALAAPLPATEAACRETLALPIRPELSTADREYVAARVIRGLFR